MMVPKCMNIKSKPEIFYIHVLIYKFAGEKFIELMKLENSKLGKKAIHRSFLFFRTPSVLMRY